MSPAAAPWRRGWFRAAVIVGTALALAVATALIRSTAPPEGEGAEGPDRAGMALRETGDGMRGGARALGGAGSLDASAGASAWPINCATLAPERVVERERR